MTNTRKTAQTKEFKSDIVITIIATGKELPSLLLQRLKEAMGIPEIVTYRPEVETTTIIWNLNAEHFNKVEN